MMQNPEAPPLKEVRIVPTPLYSLKKSVLEDGRVDHDEALELQVLIDQTENVEELKITMREIEEATLGAANDSVWQEMVLPFLPQAVLGI